MFTIWPFIFTCNYWILFILVYVFLSFKCCPIYVNMTSLCGHMHQGSWVKLTRQLYRRFLFIQYCVGSRKRAWVIRLLQEALIGLTCTKSAGISEMSAPWQGKPLKHPLELCYQLFCSEHLRLLLWSNQSTTFPLFYSAGYIQIPRYNTFVSILKHLYSSPSFDLESSFILKGIKLQNSSSAK